MTNYHTAASGSVAGNATVAALDPKTSRLTTHLKHLLCRSRWEVHPHGYPEGMYLASGQDPQEKPNTSLNGRSILPQFLQRRKSRESQVSGAYLHLLRSECSTETWEETLNKLCTEWYSAISQAPHNKEHPFLMKPRHTDKKTELW